MEKIDKAVKVIEQILPIRDEHLSKSEKIANFYRYHPLNGGSLATDFDFSVSFVCVHQSIWWIQGLIIIIVGRPPVRLIGQCGSLWTQGKRSAAHSVKSSCAQTPIIVPQWTW